MPSLMSQECNVEYVSPQRISERSLEEEAYSLGRDYARYHLKIYKGIHPLFERGAKDYIRELNRGLHHRQPETLSPFSRKLLYLRHNAVRRRLIVSPMLTSSYLQSIFTAICPVSLKPLIAIGSNTNWSVDRLINEGAYAPGNIIFLEERINCAKSSRSFSEVLDIAQRNEVVDGVTPAEWQRLATLMLGPYQLAKPCGHYSDLYFGLFTAIPEHLPRNLSHQMQELLIRIATSRTITETEKLWRNATLERMASSEPFDSILIALRSHTKMVSYVYDVWRIDQVYESFSYWWKSMAQLIALQKIQLCHTYPSMVSELARQFDAWKVRSKGRYCSEHLNLSSFDIQSK